MAKSVMWTELTAADLREKAKAGAVVLLPMGSTEQHGPHLPVGVDTFLSEGVCKAAAEAIAGELPIVVAPTLWCGMAEHHMAFGGTFTFDTPTYRAVLGCLLDSLARHGFERVLIVNGHGGNTHALAAFLPDFARETGLALRVTTPYEPAKTTLGKFLEDQDGVHHACEVETSMMMVVAPATVRRDKLPEAHGPAHWTAQPVSVARFRSFRDATASGVIGDARRASAEKGEKLLAACRDGLLAVLRDPQLWGGPAASGGAHG
jgi:creatinine amidohydrolase